MRNAASSPSLVADLYTQHHGWLHGWLRRKLGCSERAADFTQDTFLRLLSRDDVSALREPRAFLTTVARNLVADHWRRQELERAYLDALAAQPEALAPSPEERMLALEALLQLDRALGRLPALTRRIFLLSQFEGLAYNVIATQTGLSVPTVKRHMRRAFLACLDAH